MKKLVLTLALALAAMQANAATAVMINCEMGTSVTGLPVYIGTYQYGGSTFQFTFASWCPATVQVR